MFLKLDEILFCLSWPFPLLIIVGAMLLLGLVSLKTKHLSLSGALGAVVLGSVVLWCVRFEGFSVLVLFYVSSYVVGFFTRSNNENRIEKKGNRRDLMQVLANGLVCTVLALLYYNSGRTVFLVMFGSALAESTSDTWAGEIGRLSVRPPFSILNGRPVEKGTSGGVSLTGFAGGLAGSALCAGFWQYAFEGYGLKFVFSLIVLISGFLGCVLDSILGASIQAMYEDNLTGKLTEHDFDERGNQNKLVRGISFVDNDMVNLISNAVSALLSYGLFLIF